MRKTLLSFLLAGIFCFVSANALRAAGTAPSFVFNNYWMAGFTTGYAPNLEPSQLQGMNIIIVSFANMLNGQLVIMNEGATQPGPLTEAQSQQLQSQIAQLKQNGISSWIAVGGAVGPYIWDDSSLTPSQAAQMIGNLANQYGFTGVDFDYESYGPDIQNLYNIVVQIRQNYPSLGMSFTFASGGPGTTTPPYNTIPGALTALQVTTAQGSQNIFAALWPYMTYFNLMNYNQGTYCPPSTSWTATPAVIPAPWGQTGYWNQNAYVDCFYYAVQTIMSLTGFSQQVVSQKLMNGINVGLDGVNQDTITPALAASLTTEAKNQGIAGVFTWCVNRDYPGTGYQGNNSGTNNPPGAYSQAIAQAAGSN